MTGSRLQDEIQKRSFNLKKNIKELNKIISNLYNIERINNSENLQYIRKTVNDVNSAYKHLSNVEIVNKHKVISSETKEDVQKLYKITLSNIAVLEEFYKKKLSEKLINMGSEEHDVTRKNMDSLKFAYNYLKRLDTDMDIKTSDWDRIEKNF